VTRNAHCCGFYTTICYDVCTECEYDLFAWVTLTKRIMWLHLSTSMSRIWSVKAANNGTARSHIFSNADRFRLILVLEVKFKILGTVKVFRWWQNSVVSKLRLRQVSLWYENDFFENCCEGSTLKWILWIEILCRLGPLYHPVYISSECNKERLFVWKVCIHVGHFRGEHQELVRL